MAFVHVTTTDGRTVLVHTSIFDRPRSQLPTNAEVTTLWQAVWDKLDREKSDDHPA